MRNQLGEFVALVDSMTKEQRDGFLELLELCLGDWECLDAAIAWMKENGPEGVNEYIRQLKLQRDSR